MIGLTQNMDAEGLREIGGQVRARYGHGPYGHVLNTEIDGVLFSASAQDQHSIKELTAGALASPWGPKMFAGNG